MWEPLEDSICIFFIIMTFIIILRFAIGETFVPSHELLQNGKGFQQNIFARKIFFLAKK